MEGVLEFAGERVPRAAPVLALLALLSIGALACVSDVGGGAPVSAPSTAACGRCHASVPSSFAHRSSVEGCLLCHRPHAGEAEGTGPAGLQARCEDCHATELAEFSLPFHHPLGAGISCVSCHPPHGLQVWRAEREHLRFRACVGCHFEYEGPFQFEHEGDRSLLCLSCHLPHGSPNRRLLTHAETRMLCMSCHINLDQSHIQNLGSIYRGCLRCHTEVHGSNWDRELLR